MSRFHKHAVVILLIIIISILHFTTRVHHPFLHLIHQQLYLLPIIVTAYWFGKKYGLLVSALSAVLYLPWTLLAGHHESTYYHINNTLGVGLYFLVAYLIGSYRDLRVSYFTTKYPEPKPVETSPAGDGRKILLFIDDSPNALKAASYLADTFGHRDRASITILGIVRDQPENVFPNREEWEKAKTANHQRLDDLVKHAHETLTRGGIKEESIHVQESPVSKESIAEKIIEEQERFHFDTIILGGTRMSKAEEFIFGNIAVKLVRAAVGPVITVY